VRARLRIYRSFAIQTARGAEPTGIEPTQRSLCKLGRSWSLRCLPRRVSHRRTKWPRAVSLYPIPKRASWAPVSLRSWKRKLFPALATGSVGHMIVSNICMVWNKDVSLRERETNWLQGSRDQWDAARDRMTLFTDTYGSARWLLWRPQRFIIKTMDNFFTEVSWIWKYYFHVAIIYKDVLLFLFQIN